MLAVSVKILDVSKLMKFSWLPAGLFLFMTLMFTNCNDDNNSLGLDIQPPNDKLNLMASDTASVIAYSQVIDSIKTDETSLSLLGSMVDPVFGQSTVSFYTQVRLSQNAFSFGTGPLPDSLVLALDYEDFYGDSTSAMTIKVYELDAPILVDSVYFSHQSLAVKSTLLAEKTFVPDFADSVAVLGDTLAPHLRINLTDITSSLALKLLNAPADSMASNASFLNFFYGLYVTAEPVNSGGSIIYFDLMSSLSQMILYYRNATEDSLKFNYLINSNCARFGHFDHDYSMGSPAFVSQVIDKDSTLGSSVCYIQSLGGIKTFLRFPTITNYYDNGKIAVNEARFFLSCAETGPLLDPATQLIMVKRNAEGSYDILNDQLTGEGYFGGYYDDNLNGYWFRITSTIQDLLRNEDPDYGFEIYVSGGSVNAQRVILHGSDPATPGFEESRMKLVITYTNLN
jgi:hypothetical protein